MNEVHWLMLIVFVERKNGELLPRENRARNESFSCCWFAAYLQMFKHVVQDVIDFFRPTAIVLQVYWQLIEQSTLLGSAQKLQERPWETTVELNIKNF